MITPHKNNLSLNQQGQAATEFIIASVFLLVPLFLIIPILGKFIDIRHAAINKARFEAWEYTVWDLPDKTPRIDIKSSESAGMRKFDATQARAKHYFFSDPTSDTYSDPNASFKANPQWLDHRGDSLFTSTDIFTGTIQKNETPATFGENSPDILNFFFDAMGLVTSVFSAILQFEQVDGTFDVLKPEYRNNYVSSHVNVEVRSLGDILPRYYLGGERSSKDTTPLTIHAKAAVLSDPWNSGSTANASAESRGLVLTAFLSPLSTVVNDIIGGINKGLDYIPLIDIKLPSMPEFGYVDDDIIPHEFLEEHPGESKEEFRLNYYE